jgi:oxygen-independent coproporphyrinogen-3 oxidase
MTSQIHALAERVVPRYTSYPTAPHFSNHIRSDTYALWLRELPVTARLSLYLHVPFCTEICLYCGCHTKATKSRAPLESYVETLTKEISLVGEQVEHQRISHLHWGGGTPSILDQRQLMGLLEQLNRAFDTTEIREHAIELDPRHVTAALVCTLNAMGVNRVSLGVQEFSADVQKAIRRIQPYEVVRQAVDTLRDGGIVDLNFDLMYGLPRQTIRDLSRTAELTASFGPQRIALFGYAHVPWFKAQQRLIDTSTLPGTLERIGQMETARETLVSLGYEPIGLDHFARSNDNIAVAAREGRLHRNFQGYTTDDADALIGLGASAIGRLPQGFVQNSPDRGGYSRAIAAGRLATAKGLQFSLDDRLRGRIIEMLLCDLRVDLDAIADDFALGAHERFQPEIETLQPLASEGILKLEEHRIVVIEKGRPFVRLVAAAFDSYLKDSRARHSVAV